MSTTTKPGDSEHAGVGTGHSDPFVLSDEQRKQFNETIARIGLVMGRSARHVSAKNKTFSFLEHKVFTLPKADYPDNFSSPGKSQLETLDHHNQQHMLRDLFSPLGVYGWEPVQKAFLAGLVGKFPVLLLGEAGTAKTYAYERLGFALDLASQELGLGKVDYKYRNASTATIENMVGFPFPHMPDIEEAHREGRLPKMGMLYSADTLAEANMLAIDEINRATASTQNRWFSIVNERRCDGVDLPINYVIGMMNPWTNNSGAERLDRAFADRFVFLIKVPQTWKMSEKNQEKIAEARFHRGENGVLSNEAVDYGAKIEMAAALDMHHTLERARKGVHKVQIEFGSQIVKYVINVLREINQATEKKDGANAIPVDGRRYAMIAQGMLAFHALSRELEGDKADLKKDALECLGMSFLQEVTGEDAFNPSMIIAAHDTHKGLLESREKALYSQISAEKDDYKRVSMAFNIGKTREITTFFVQEVHNKLKKTDPAKAMAFSYVLLNRIQNEPRLYSLLDKSVIDDLGADVIHVRDTFANFDSVIKKVIPRSGGTNVLMSVLLETLSPKTTPIHRAAVALALAQAKSIDLSTSGTDTDADDTMLSERCFQIFTNILHAETALTHVVKMLSAIK